MKRMTSGGGWKAILYSLGHFRRAGWRGLWDAMVSRNACKTCALGMGGQRGGMVNEIGHFPEVCKKSFQAMTADMQAGLTAEFFRRYGFRELRSLTPRELEYSGRLAWPLYAGPNDTHYRQIGWDEAVGKLADRLRTSAAFDPNRNFFYVSGRSSNEAGFLIQLLARLTGTNNVNNCSYYCHQASGVGLAGSVGAGTGTVALEDVEKADLFFLVGGNPASNHPRLMRSLMKIRRSGGKVIVVNPVKETGLVNFSVPSDPISLFFGTEIASKYLMPHIGGDLALFTGLAKAVIERNAVDSEFVASATEGFEAFRDHVARIGWDEIEAGCGLERRVFDFLADEYLAAKNVVFAWTMGVTHHEHGVATVQTLANVAMLRGMVGRPAAGLMPIRGHSNVQGIGSVGVTPALKDAVFERLQNHFGIKLPTAPGLDTMACMRAAEAGNVDVAVCLGGNLYGSNPDSTWAEKAMGRIGMVAYLSTTLNTGHAWGRGKETLILPVLARDEEPEPTTQESMFSYVRLSDGGIKRLDGPRSEVSVLADLAGRVLGDAGPVDWSAMRRHHRIREAISAVVPGYERLQFIDKTKEEFQIPGRTLRTPVFPTKSGKARFIAHPIPALKGDPGELRLMTVRSEGQFNTVVYEDQDIYRAQERRDVILMAADDITARGLKVDQKVRVSSSAGVMDNILVREWDIRPGNCLMYYPEANVLVPTGTDPLSKTPAFKCVPVTVTAMERVPVIRSVALKMAKPEPVMV
jgi:molybdopterin-dependent oxidoreductase alpha subunit